MVAIPDIFLKRFLTMKNVTLQIGIAMLTGMYIMLSFVLIIVNGTEFTNGFSTSHYLLIAIIISITFIWLVAFLGAYLSSMWLTILAFVFWTIFIISWIAIVIIRLANGDKSFCVANQTRCAPTMWLFENYSASDSADSPTTEVRAVKDESTFERRNKKVSPKSTPEDTTHTTEETPCTAEHYVVGNDVISVSEPWANSRRSDYLMPTARENNVPTSFGTTKSMTTHTTEPFVLDRASSSTSDTAGEVRVATSVAVTSEEQGASVWAVTKKRPAPSEWLGYPWRRDHAIRILKEKNRWHKPVTADVNGGGGGGGSTQREKSPFVAVASATPKRQSRPSDDNLYEAERHGEVFTAEGKLQPSGNLFQTFFTTAYFLVLYLYSWFVLLSYIVELKCIKSCRCHQHHPITTEL